eukprot:4872565-Lingulodinium_polyedra.AAC.2
MLAQHDLDQTGRELRCALVDHYVRQRGADLAHSAQEGAKAGVQDDNGEIEVLAAAQPVHATEAGLMMSIAPVRPRGVEQLVFPALHLLHQVQCALQDLVRSLLCCGQVPRGPLQALHLVVLLAELL